MIPIVPAGEPDPLADMVRGRLFERRVVLVRGTLDDLAASEAAAQLMALDGLGDDAVQLHLDCEGTSVAAALSLMDVIDLLGVPVVVLCTGRVEGPAVGVVAVASRRTAAPHTRFRFCEPRASAEGSFADLTRWAEQHERELDALCRRIGEATGRSPAAVRDDMRAGRYVDAEEARRLGLIDEITARPAPVRALREPRIGYRPPG